MKICHVDIFRTVTFTHWLGVKLVAKKLEFNPSNPLFKLSKQKIQFLLIFNTYFRLYLVCCYVCYGFWMCYDLISCFNFIKATSLILLKVLVTWNLGVKVGGFISLSQQKVNEIPPKKKNDIFLLPGHGFTNVWSELWWWFAEGLFLMKTVGRGM